MTPQWTVYMLRCADGSLYTGVTTNPNRRVAQHNAGTASRYTRSRLPVQLVYEEFEPSRSAALKRELAIKELSRVDCLLQALIVERLTNGLVANHRDRRSFFARRQNGRGVCGGDQGMHHMASTTTNRIHHHDQSRRSVSALCH